MRFGLRTLATALLAAATSFGQLPETAADLAAQVRSQNEQVLQLTGGTGSLASAASLAPGSALRSLLESRTRNFESLIGRDTAAALELRLPSATIAELLQLAPDAAAILEHDGSWNGVAELLIRDDFVGATSRELVHLQADDELVEVYFSGGSPPVESGQQISVQGMRIGDVVAAVSSSASDSAFLGPVGINSCTTTGPQRVAVLLVQFSGGASLPAWATPAYFNDAIFSTTNPSLNRYWQENSSGLTTATGGAYGPYTIQPSCSTSTIKSRAKAAATNVNFNNFERVMIIFPEQECGFVGLGSIGSCPSTNWMTVGSGDSHWSYIVAFAGHEGGHNIGLRHASTLEFGDEQIGALNDPGTHCEYGNVFSTMGIHYQVGEGGGVTGAVTGHYAAQHKVQLGWLGAGSGYQQVETNGSFAVLPSESGSGLRALKIRRGTGNDRWVWVEYRQSLGDFDPRLSRYSSSAYSGGLLHYEDPSSSYSQRSRVVDFQPGFPSSNGACTSNGNMGSADMRHVTMQPGETWSDPFSDLTIETPSADASGLDVIVSYGAPTCDLNGDQQTNVVDVQLASRQVLALDPCGSGDLDQNGSCTSVDVQRVVAATLGGSCVIGP